MRLPILAVALSLFALADPPAGTLSLSGSSINTNIISLIYPGASHTDVVSGDAGTLGGAGATFAATGESGGTALGSDGTAGANWAHPTGFGATSANWSILIRAALSSVTGGGYECVICNPYHTNFSGPPYYTLGLVRQGGTTANVMLFSSSDDNDNEGLSGPDDFWLFDGAWHDYGMVKTGPFVRFYRDGSQFGTDLFGSNASHLNVGDSAPLHLMPSGVVGKVNFSAVWSRDASGDFASLFTDKNQLVTGTSASAASKRRQVF